MFQLALFPQFVDPARGSVLVQSLMLGATQIVIDVVGRFAVRARGGRRAPLVRARVPRGARWSQARLAGVFAALAARLALDELGVRRRRAVR